MSKVLDLTTIDDMVKIFNKATKSNIDIYDLQKWCKNVEKRNGKPTRSRYRQKALKMIIQNPKLNNHQIAEKLNCSYKTVQRVRRQHNSTKEEKLL